MLRNRSMPSCSVIPELGYPHVPEAADWLFRAFEFSLRLRIADHRAQLKIGDGGLIVRTADAQNRDGRCSVMVRVERIDLHYERALTFGARVVSPPADYPYGERQYTVE